MFYNIKPRPVAGFFVFGMMGADYVTLVINMTNAHTTITI